MNKRIIIAAAMLAVLLPSNAKRLERDLERFTRIYISGAYDVRYVKGDVYKVVIEGEEEQCMECTETKVGHDGVLKIYSNKKYGLFDNDGNDNAAWKITVTAPAIEEIQCSGAADFYTSECLSGRKLRIETAGASDVVMTDVAFDELEIIASGASDLNVQKGAKVKSISLKASGSSDIVINGLAGDELNADVSGSADVKITNAVLKNAMIEASGASDVVVRGKIDNMTHDASGSSSVRYRNK